MRNPYMKFQNPSFKFFLNGRTNEKTKKQTNGRTSQKQYAPHFFKVGGIKSEIVICRIGHFITQFYIDPTVDTMLDISNDLLKEKWGGMVSY